MSSWLAWISTPSSPARCACSAEKPYSRTNQRISSRVSACGTRFTSGPLSACEGPCGIPPCITSCAVAAAPAACSPEAYMPTRSRQSGRRQMPAVRAPTPDGSNPGGIRFSTKPVIPPTQAAPARARDTQYPTCFSASSTVPNRLPMAEAWGGSMMRLRSCIGPMVKGSKMRDSAGAAGGVVVAHGVSGAVVVVRSSRVHHPRGFCKTGVLYHGPCGVSRSLCADSH
jgi:hypothetical protein